LRLAVDGLVALQFVLAFWDFFAGRRLPLPDVVHQERRLLALDKPGDLFSSIT